MKKTFTFEGTEFIANTCTAVAVSIGDTERQNALLIEEVRDYFDPWDRFAVVFNYGMPENDADFAAMIDDADAWDYDGETLKSVICWDGQPMTAMIC